MTRSPRDRSRSAADPLVNNASNYARCASREIPPLSPHPPLLRFTARVTVLADRPRNQHPNYNIDERKKKQKEEKGERWIDLIEYSFP